MEKRINTLLPTLLNKEDSSYSTVKDLDNVLNHAEKLNVRNIAITGPFGSGKSSVLHTLMHDFKDDKRVYLPISLATLQANEGFSKTSDDDESISRNEQYIENLNRKIEQSILQQLIYKEKAEDVPNSRFRRIVHLSKEKLNKYWRWGIFPWIAAYGLTKNLATTEHEEGKVIDSMHLRP